jgi:hypothetical protein
MITWNARPTAMSCLTHSLMAFPSNGSPGSEKAMKPATPARAIILGLRNSRSYGQTEGFHTWASILLLLGADHGCNGSCARVAGSWPIAWVGLDDDHLRTVAIDDWARLGDRACGNNIDEGGNAVRRVAAITWVALPSTPARWRVRVQYVGKAFETCGC